MITFSYKKIRCIAMVLLALPTIIFCMGWLRTYIGLPVSIILAAVLVFSGKSTDERKIEMKKSTLALLLLMILIWCIMAGQGGFWKQQDDHFYRNPTFHDLINYKWPVMYNDESDRMLTYYIGHWLLPALVGKVFAALLGFSAGWLAARIAMLLWSLAIIFIVVLLINFTINQRINRYTDNKNGASVILSKKAAVCSLLIMIFFGGMDLLGMIIAHKPGATLEDIYNNGHFEWWATYFQYTSISVQFNWVYNQAVPAWLGITLFMSDNKRVHDYAFIAACLIITSPLPLLGLAALMVPFAARILFNNIKNKSAKSFVKDVFSLQNVSYAVLAVPIMAIYYQKNSANAATLTNPGRTGNLISQNLYVYIVFLAVEFFILSLLIYNKNNRFEIITILAELTVIPFFHVGAEYDFCMRGSIPALFVLMILTQEYVFTNFKRFKEFDLNHAEKITKKDMRFITRFIAVVLCLFIGAVTPFAEYEGLAMDTISSGFSVIGNQDILSSLSNFPVGQTGNFTSIDGHDTFFYRYLSRQNNENKEKVNKQT